MSWTDDDIEDLRDLQRALNAVEDKRLAHCEYVDENGLCCANTVLAKWRGIDAETLTFNTAHLIIGISERLHSLIARANDQGFDKEGVFKSISPEERYERMCRWVDRQLAESA